LMVWFTTSYKFKVSTKRRINMIQHDSTWFNMGLRLNLCISMSILENLRCITLDPCEELVPKPDLYKTMSRAKRQKIQKTGRKATAMGRCRSIGDNEWSWKYMYIQLYIYYVLWYGYSNIWTI
jgi:hypothetical protein